MMEQQISELNTLTSVRSHFSLQRSQKTMACLAYYCLLLLCLHYTNKILSNCKLMNQNLHGGVSCGCCEAVQGRASQATERAATYSVLAVVGSSVVRLCGLVGLLRLFAHDRWGGPRRGASGGCLSTLIGVQHPGGKRGPRPGRQRRYYLWWKFEASCSA